MGCNYRQWVRFGGISDHSPIYLHIRGGMNKPKAPFKFNSTWLKDAAYIKMVSDYWKSHHPIDVGNIAEMFAHYLSYLKKLTKI